MTISAFIEKFLTDDMEMEVYSEENKGTSFVFYIQDRTQIYENL